MLKAGHWVARWASLSVFGVTLGVVQSARAAPKVPPLPAASAGESRPALGWDIETDPIAYLGRGHSLHVGLRLPHWRFDVGTFALLVPEFIHRQSDFEDWASGYGAKLDGYLRADHVGPFLGVEGALLQQRIVDRRSDRLERVSSFSAGIRAGWEFQLGRGFFIKPWIGVGYRFGHDEVQVAERRFQQSPLLIFPTFHIGYLFP